MLLNGVTFAVLFCFPNGLFVRVTPCATTFDSSLVKIPPLPVLQVWTEERANNSLRKGDAFAIQAFPASLQPKEPMRCQRYRA
jgi:hypothetical protein